MAAKTMSVSIIRWMLALAVVVLLLPVAGYSKTTPKLIKIETVEFDETSDQIFRVTIPYIHLAPMHQEVVKRYKDVVLKSIAKDSHTDLKDYHVKRVSMSDEAPKGTYLIYYETIYNKSICEISVVDVDRQGNYSIKTSLC